MNVCYQADNVKLICGDVIETLNQFEAESFDLIFADPPYNLSNDGITCKSGRQASVNKAEWDRSSGFEIDHQFHNNWINACKRVLKPNGTIWISGTYHSIFSCGFALQSQQWHIINDVAWFKPNAAPNLACRQLAASHETLIWAKKSKSAKHTFNYQFLKHSKWEGDNFKKPTKQMRSVWAINTPSPKEKTHGKHVTQKPVNLMERIILASSNEGDLVLDPFCGSGTTGVASVNHGRNFVGIDSEGDYLSKIAKPRLEEAINNIKIRDNCEET